MVKENMVSGRALYKMLLLVFLLPGSPALAGPAQEAHFIGRYDFTWSDIPLASAELSVDRDAGHYTLRFAVVSRGLVNLFTRHRSDTTVSGTFHAGAFRPALYDTRYWTKDKPRHIRLGFDAAGRITQETVEPPEDRQARPEVPGALKDGALDPLTLLIAVPAGNVTPKVFDGKRLYEGLAVKQAPASLRLSTGPRDAVPYIFTRKPLAGLTTKEANNYAQGEQPLSIYFSADGSAIPLYATVPLYMGRLQGELTRECKSWNECRVN